jgi:hypothetical protein
MQYHSAAAWRTLRKRWMHVRREFTIWRWLEDPLEMDPMEVCVLAEPAALGHHCLDRLNLSVGQRSLLHVASRDLS